MLGGILLVLATSLDGFSAGAAYGMRGMSFPVRNRLIVAGISFAAMTLAMLAGGAAGGIFPGGSARLIGGLLLIALGIWTALRGVLDGGRDRIEERVWSWDLPSLGLVIQILRQPMQADLDASGGISAVESVWLGLALSLDAFAAGFCANLSAGLPYYLPCIVAIVNWLFLSAGIICGHSIVRARAPVMAVLPGVILVLLGLVRVL